jgi:hypothetical protein
MISSADGISEDGAGDAEARVEDLLMTQWYMPLDLSARHLMTIYR